MKKKKRLTQFGRTVRDLMESREIYEWKALTDELNEEGWPGTRSTLSNYVHGKHPVHPSVIPCLVRALNLTEEEKRRLADAFAFGQGFNSDSMAA